MFAEAIESILNDHCSPSAVRAIETGSSASALTDAIDQAGFFGLLASEEDAGGGAGWDDFHAIASLCGAHAVPIPLVQTLAARLLAATQADLPPGLLTFAPSLIRAAGGSLQAHHVPGGRLASHVIGVAGDALVILPTSGAHQIPTGVHGSLAASFRWEIGSEKPLRSKLPASALQPMAALVHAGMLAGAMKRVFDMTMAYANERVQFGKSIGKFQAIQHQLSVMAEHVAAAAMASEAAFHCDGPGPSIAACAVAKARTSEAAQLVASIAHAIHGAIGVTEEYDLQLYTRRLHEWRAAHGSELYWNRLLGRLFIQCEQPLAADFVRTIF